MIIAGLYEYFVTFSYRRRPAWTDRILYRTADPMVYGDRLKLSIEQTSYKSHPGFDISDHKPVSSRFHLAVFPPRREPIVTFQPISDWHIGVEAVIDYHIEGYVPKQWDWIGVFKEGFHALDSHDFYNWCTRIPGEDGGYRMTFATQFLLPGR